MTTKKLPRVKVLSAVVCDDVRQESTGKDLLIGVYSGTIAVHILPSPPVSLRCWINFEARGSGTAKVNFRVVDHKNQTLIQSETNMQVQDQLSFGSIPIGPFVYVLKDPEGSFKVEYKYEGKNWETLITKKVKYQSK